MAIKDYPTAMTAVQQGLQLADLGPDQKTRFQALLGQIQAAMAPTAADVKKAAATGLQQALTPAAADVQKAVETAPAGAKVNLTVPKVTVPKVPAPPVAPEQ